MALTSRKLFRIFSQNLSPWKLYYWIKCFLNLQRKSNYTSTWQPFKYWKMVITSPSFLFSRIFVLISFTRLLPWHDLIILVTLFYIFGCSVCLKLPKVTHWGQRRYKALLTLSWDIYIYSYHLKSQSFVFESLITVLVNCVLIVNWNLWSFRELFLGH